MSDNTMSKKKCVDWPGLKLEAGGYGGTRVVPIEGD